MPGQPRRTEHQRAADRLTAQVLARAEAGGLAISSEIRREATAIMRRIAVPGKPLRQSLAEFLTAFPAILRRYEPLLSRTAADTQLAAFLFGGQGVAQSLPGLPESVTPPPWTSLPLPPEPERRNVPRLINFPMIEEAAKDLTSRRILGMADLELAYADATAEGSRFGRAAANDAYEKVRDALIEAVVDGDGLPTFRAKVSDAIDTSQISEGRIENVFRTNAFWSYARGQRAVIEQPLVRTVGVFVLRANIDDSRCTTLCRILSRSGYQGTGIYLVASPLWRLVAPPSHYGCRCGAVYLTIKRAAQKGIKVAQKWLETGHRPDAELFLPMPDLSGLTEKERMQFEMWQSPWADAA